MTKEMLRVGSYNAREPKKAPQTREQWADSLIENLQSRHAIEVFDARTSPLPEHLLVRLNKENSESFSTYMNTIFGKDWKSHTKGKTYAVAYAKFGHGHKHQAVDLALILAETTNSRVIVFDPMDALPDRERMLILHKKDLHKAMQFRDPKIIERIKTEIKTYPNSPWWQPIHDALPYREAYMLGEIAMQNLPAQHESGNSDIGKQTSKIAQKMQQFVTEHPLFFARLMSLAETEATERSVSAATAAIAAMYGADAILTTMVSTIRAVTPDVLTWLPKHLRKPARHALQTIITVTPDNGYTKRKLDGSESQGLNNSEIMDDIAICFPHAFMLRNRASWLRRTIHVVADDIVAERFSAYWKVPKSDYFPFGTVADSLSPSEFQQKWQQRARRILIASNGNGSNIPDAIRAMKEIAAASPTWLHDHDIHLDVFIADLPEKLPDLVAAAKEAGLEDQVEIIDFTRDYYNKGQLFTYSKNPKKRIHIAYGTGDAPGSDLKQHMQRLAHIEIRSPGENALTGANVGTLELCTPPGGPNEIYNMIWASRQLIAFPINWTSDPNAKPWQDTGFSTEHGLIDDASSKNFPSLITSILQNDMATAQAETAYRRVNKQTPYGIIGLLVGELMQRHNVPVPDRETLKQNLQTYMKNRNADLSTELDA